jgi:tetratricopeptide (TPR) repeat protein
MNEQKHPHPEGTPTEGGVTHPHADQFHARLLEEFKQSLAAHPEGVYARWGYTWLHSMSDEDAMVQREALGYQLVDALDHYNHGCLLASRETYADAAKAFAKAVELDPKLVEARFNHALALELAGKTAEARAAWKACVEPGAELPDEEIKQIKDHLGALADA